MTTLNILAMPPVSTSVDSWFTFGQNGFGIETQSHTLLDFLTPTPFLIRFKGSALFANTNNGISGSVTSIELIYTTTGAQINLPASFSITDFTSLDLSNFLEFHSVPGGFSIQLNPNAFHVLTDGDGDTVKAPPTFAYIFVDDAHLAAVDPATGVQLTFHDFETPSLMGGAGNDTLKAGAVPLTMTGGAGADTYVFDAAAPTEQGTAAPGQQAAAAASAQQAIGGASHISDYDQGNTGLYSAAEGDKIDISALVSTAYNHGSGQVAGALVRVIGSSTGADLQIDRNGTVNGANWVTLAHLDGIRAGNSINVILDSSLPGGTNISVGSDNRPPVITSNGGGDAASISVPENTAAVTIVAASDPDAAATLTYSVSGGADAAKFQINPSTGSLAFVTAPDFEAPGDADHNNSYIVQVRASDGSLADTQTITVNVTNVTEGGPDDFAGNTSTLGRVSPGGSIRGSIETAGDRDWFRVELSAGFTYVFRLNGAANGAGTLGDPYLRYYDSVGFLIFENDNSNGTANAQLIITPGQSGPAYLAAGESGDNSTGTYELSVSAPNHTPVIISEGGLDRPAIFVPENRTIATQVVATDADPGTTITYAITAGEDAGRFIINPTTGVLSFIAPPDFESPNDSDRNNSYVVQVRVSDGSLFDFQVITINVTNVKDSIQWMNSVDIGPHPAGWLPAGVGDFNNDGSSDLLWFNQGNGNAEVWKLANGKWAGSVNIGAHPAGWSPAGVGDVNHDGTSDVVWFNPTNRDVEVWKIANGGWAGSVDIGVHPAGWTPSGVGDFNGDGTSDVLWYNAATGNAEVWKISNGQWAGSVNIGLHPLGWRPAGVGDFNGDGTSDVLWYNAATGNAEVWKISNGQWAGSVNIGQHPLGWVPVGVTDFNQDGTSDVTWFNAGNGNVEIWQIVDGGWAGSVNVGAHPLGSAPAGVGDFNHDFVGDVLWRDTNTGRIEAWLLANT